MPELPEVEVIRIGLLPLLVGKRIVTIRHSGKSLRTPVPLARMQKILINAVITDIQRRAKYLLFPTDHPPWDDRETGRLPAGTAGSQA
jgi:formamidopyrimidine-DNA glycosylase